MQTTLYKTMSDSLASAHRALIVSYSALALNAAGQVSARHCLAKCAVDAEDIRQTWRQVVPVHCWLLILIKGILERARPAEFGTLGTH